MQLVAQTFIVGRKRAFHALRIRVPLLVWQGTSLQDVTVYADPNCAAGVAGGNGGGGTFTGVTIVGARLGLDMRSSQVCFSAVISSGGGLVGWGEPTSTCTCSSTGLSTKLTINLCLHCFCLCLS